MSLELEKRLGTIFFILGIVAGLTGVCVWMFLMPKVFGPYYDSEFLFAFLNLMIFELVGGIVAIIGVILYSDWKVQTRRIEEKDSE